MLAKLFGSDQPAKLPLEKLATPAVCSAVARLDAARAALAEQEAVRDRLQASYDRLREALAQVKSELRPLDPASGHPVPDAERVARISAGLPTDDLDERDRDRRARVLQLDNDARIAGRLLREHSANLIPGQRDGGPLVVAQRDVREATEQVIRAMRDAARKAELPPMLVMVEGRSEQIGVPQSVALDDALAAVRTEGAE